MIFTKNCCNTFTTHKTTIKQNFRVISVKFAKDLKKNQLAIIPEKNIWENQDWISFVAVLLVL